MKAEELLKADIPPTEIPFPEGLAEILVHFPELRIRRGTLVFLDDQFLPVPDRDYKISHTGLIIPFPIKTLSVVSVVIPSADERWYYSHADGWGRL